SRGRRRQRHPTGGARDAARRGRRARARTAAGRRHGADPRTDGSSRRDRPRLAGRPDRGRPRAREAAVDDPGAAGRSGALMSFLRRGFGGRRRDDADPARVPPGQYVTDDYPVLSAGPTPHTPLDRWDFSVVGELDELRRWTWDELLALPSDEI